MVEIYVTNTETTYTDNGVFVDLYGRNEDRELRRVRVGGFEPYFFVEREVAEDLNPTAHEDIASVDPDVEDESLMGDALGEIVASHPGAISDLRELWEDTWGADVRFTNRLRIDEEIKTGVRAPATQVTADEIEPVDLRREERRVTFDIEIDDRGEFPESAHRRIISIAAHDSYTDSTAVFVDTDGEELEDFLPRVAAEQEAPDGIDELYFRPDESGMLRNFVDWIEDKDPDLLVGWNSDDFDVPYTIDRMNRLGVNPDRLARDKGTAYTDGHGGSIHGRSCYDLMLAWESTKFTEPDSTKLDHAASVELDDAKLDYDEGGTWELYQDNPRELLKYNAKDVELTHRVGVEAVYAFKRRLRNMVGVDWGETIQNNDFVGMMVRRKLYRRGERGPTKPSSITRDDYEGAYTLDPYTGVANNVVEIDLSSLYPMTIWMLNASPETKLTEKEARERDFEDVAQAPNDVYYDLREDGIFKELVSDSLELKREYKQELKETEPGTEEEETAAENYAVAKTVTNCFTPDTEVLTPEGVRSITELEVGDPLYSYDKESGEMVRDKVDKVWEYPDYDGDLHHFQNSATDFKVTPNHRMLVKRDDKYRSDNEYRYVEAQDLVAGDYKMPSGWNTDHETENIQRIDLLDYHDEGEVRVTLEDDVHGRTFREDCGQKAKYDDNTGKYVFSVEDYFEKEDEIKKYEAECEFHLAPFRSWVSRYYDVNNFLELLAWYITEGSCYDDERAEITTFHIAQEDDRHRDEIEDLLDRMEFEYHDSGQGFEVSSRAVTRVLEELGGSSSFEKKIPEFIFRLPEEKKEAFLETMVDGDGDRQKESFRYTTSSDQLRDDFLRLCVEVGYTPQYTEDSGSWRIYVNETRKNTLRPSRDETMETAEDGVYCVSASENSNIIAGRNGNFQFVGQSIYGVTGWEWFFLYDKEVAESITVMSQQVTRKTENWVNQNTEGEVIYGDTDSCYISFPDDLDQKDSLLNAERAVRKLNDEIFPDLAEQYGMGSVECRWEMELEKYCSSFFQAGKKKRYSFVKTWKEGMDYDDKIDEFDITGFECVKSDTAHITRELQRTVLEAAVRGRSEEEISDILYEYTKKVKEKPDDWEYIGIPQGIGKSFDNYETDTAHVRGAKIANKYLGLEIGVGDKPYRCYLDDSLVSNGEERERTDVVCYENDNEVRGEHLSVDVNKMQTTVVKKPLQKIVDALGINISAAMKGQTQSGLKAFM